MRVLIVTRFFPPSSVANARRPFLLAKALGRRGHDVVVATAGDRPGVEAAGPGVRVVRVADPVMVWRQRWGRRRLVRTLVHRLWPDEAVLWVMAARRWIRAGAEDRELGVVYVHPVSALLLPACRTPAVPWVVDYLESVSPFRRAVPHEYLPHRWLGRWVEAFERKALRRTRGAVFTSRANLQAVVSLGWIHPERATYIPFACEPIPGANEPFRTASTLVMAHLGYFNRDRSPEALLKGLAEFLRRVPRARGRIRLDLFGNGLGPFAPLPEKLGLGDAVAVLGEREYGEIVHRFVDAHLLVLVASPTHNLFYPSKLAEYLAARRPILALVPPASEAHEVLRASGRDRWVRAYDAPPAEVADCLMEAWSEFEAGRLGFPLPEWRPALFEEHVDRWVAVLEAARAGRPFPDDGGAVPAAAPTI